MPDRHNSHRRLFVLSAAAAVALVLAAAGPARANGPILGGATTENSPEAGVWQSGAPPYGFIASAATGIRSMQVSIDGQLVELREFPCTPVCGGSQILTTNLPTTNYRDGQHTLTTSATDGSGITASRSIPLKIDNTAPAPPRDVAIATGWRADPALHAAWTNPAQQLAPLLAARYRLCPADVASANPVVAAQAGARCVEGTLAAPMSTRMFPGPVPTELPDDLELPAPGAWTMRIWLVDAAGNGNPDAATTIAGLGYDPTPPQVAGFAAQAPKDPTRVTVAAAEDGAPLTGGAIEVRRRGSQAWRPLATALTAGGIAARVDDERLRKGRYELRATVTNAAGLQHATDRSLDGAAKTLSLPVRRVSRLQAGRRTGTRCTASRGKRRCRDNLQRKLAVAFGRRITLRARLTSQRKPIKGQTVEVWERLSLAGAAWQRIGAVQTDRRGRVRYKTRRGPARTLRFRYPGSPRIRGTNADVALRVQAKPTLRVSRRDVINGEYVAFKGRLLGGDRPAAGVLVELQVRSRGKWRTFAQPRADAASGAWRYQYRFETVSGGARFRFRARVRRQAGYPYATGHSRPISVRVRGL